MRYVKYVGLAHTRMLTAADWRSKGITADPVVWDAFNGFAVPLDAFTEDQLRKVIEPDDNLIVVGENEDGSEFVPDLSAARQMTPSEFEAPRVDILDPVDVPNASVAGSETSTAAPTRTGRGTAGHDNP